MFRIAALNETSGREEDPEKIKLTKTKEAKEAEAFALYNKALSYQQKGHSVHAEKLLKNLLVEHPLLQEASELVEDVNKHVSIVTHRGLQLLYSVHKNMAAIYLHRNELDSAIKSYIEAVRIDPSEVTVWFKMGQIAMKLDKFALAKISFQQALECNNHHWPSLDQAITLTFALGDYLMCLEFIATALENDSSYLKGLALMKQIVREQPSLEEMTSHLFENCDAEIHRAYVTKEERKEFVDEATKIRSKARQLANDFYEDQNKPVAFLEPLTPFTWKNMGEQLIKLYDFATNNDSPKSLGQEVDLRDYFFLDPTLFLGQDSSDDVQCESMTREEEKRKSPKQHVLSGSKEIVTPKSQTITDSSIATGRSAFQRASSQSDVQSKAVPDVLGIQDGAKESALLKRMQGRMISSSSSGAVDFNVKEKLTETSISNQREHEEEAMDVSIIDGGGVDINVSDNIGDIDMPLLDGVDLDINLTDIQKIDLKPELLLKGADDEDEEFANLASDVKSLDNVLSSVIDMEYERKERDSEGNSDYTTKTDERESTVVKKLSFSDKPQSQDSNEVIQPKDIPTQKGTDSSLMISKSESDLQQEMLPRMSSATVVLKSPSLSTPQISDSSYSPSTKIKASQPHEQLSTTQLPTTSTLDIKSDDQDKDLTSKSSQSRFETTEQKDLSLTRHNSTTSDNTLVADSFRDCLSGVECDSSVFEKTLVSTQKSCTRPSTEQPMEISGEGNKKELDKPLPSNEGGPSLTLTGVENAILPQDSVTLAVAQENLMPSQLASLLTKTKESVLMSGDIQMSENPSLDTMPKDFVVSLDKASQLLESQSTPSSQILQCSVTHQTPAIAEDSMISPLLKAALTDTSSGQPRKDIKENVITVVESKLPKNDDVDIIMKYEQLSQQKQKVPSNEMEGTKLTPDQEIIPQKPVSSISLQNLSPSKPLKDFSISSLISNEPMSDSLVGGSRKQSDGNKGNDLTRDSVSSSSSFRGSSDASKYPSAGFATSLADTAATDKSSSLADHTPKPSTYAKAILSPRKSTGDLIEDVIRSELSLADKMPTTKPSPKFHQQEQHTAIISQTKSAAGTHSSGISPSHSSATISTSSPHGKTLQSPQTTHNTFSPTNKSRKPSSSSPSRQHGSPAGTSSSTSPYSSLLQHRPSVDPFANLLAAHSGLPITASDLLLQHHSIHKELAFLNLPMHYINSISTLEAEAILRKAALATTMSDQQLQREDALMRDLLLRHSQQQHNSSSSTASLTSAFANPAHHNPRQLSRSLSSPGGYFSEHQRHHPDLSAILPQLPHSFLTPPIPAAHGAQLLPLSSFPLRTTPILPDFHPSHNITTTRPHSSIPSPYPLLSHHYDITTTTSSTNPTPFSSPLYPPLSPRSKYPLIPSTSPSYLKSRLPPHLSSLLQHDTSSSLHHQSSLHPHLSPSSSTTKPSTSSDINMDTSTLHHHHNQSRPTTANPSSIPVRKALFTTTTTSNQNQTHESPTSPLAKSKKISPSHRSVSSTIDTEVMSSAVSTRQEHFQKMIEQMLESSKSTSSSHCQTSTKISSTQSGSLKESGQEKRRHRSPVTSTSPALCRQSQRAPRRKLEELGTSEWAEVFRGGRSTRSRSNRGKKEEPIMDIAKVILTHFPPSLLELTEVIDNDSTGDEENKDVGKSESKIGSQRIDLSKIVSIAERETEEVKAFLKSCLKGNGILDLIFKYLLQLAGRVSIVWTENLTETFMHVYKRLRKHITTPKVFDNFDGFTPDGLDKYTQVMLAYCELVTDAARYRGSITKTAAVMSPEAGSGAGSVMTTETDVATVTEQLGEFYKEDMTFLSAITRCEDVIGAQCLSYSVRIFWLQAKYHQLCRETIEALDCFHMVNELIGDVKEESSKVIVLPNLKEDKMISQQEVAAQVDALQRCKSLENTKSLFDKGDYAAVVDSLLQTFNKKSVKESKERPSQLLLLLDSLSRLDRKEESLRWAEVCITEALSQFKSVKTQTIKQTWASTMTVLFGSTDRLLSENVTILISLGSGRLTRLSHNLVSVMKIILDTDKRSSAEMPINTLLPWIILYRILKHKELQADRDETNGEEAKGDNEDDNDEDDEEDESDLKPSIKMLIQAHDHLGRHGWCTKEDGLLLFFLMKELDSLMKELDEDDDDRDICVHAYEQCLYCLYNHPSKKGKAKHLRDHSAKPIVLTWDRALPVFHYFTQTTLPEFDSKKTSSISVDVEHLLRRIFSLVPPRISPAAFKDAVTSFIDGTTSEVVIPSVFQQAISSVVSLEEEKVQGRLYYLLADFYMKNSELKKAVKFYQFDLVMNRRRMDSWAGLALAKMNEIEYELSCIDLRLDMLAPKKWDGAMRCFQRAVDCDGKSRKLWVEFGLLAYQLQAHASRQARVFASSSTHRDFAQTARDRHTKYLESAMSSFQHALACKCDGGDGTKDDWLIHYMLGKIAEKQTPKKPAAYLHHYGKAAKCLHAEKALYPEKIQFATTPPHLALEALEVFYRCHASILKLMMMHGGIADQDLPGVYTVSVRSLTGSFARCVKHKGTTSTNEADREERSSTTTSTSGQNAAPSVPKGKKLSQPKTAISDHSYSKERRVSTSQSQSSTDTSTEKHQRGGTMSVEKSKDRNKDVSAMKSILDGVGLAQEKDVAEDGEEKKEKKTEKMDIDTENVVENVSDSKNNMTDEDGGIILKAMDLMGDVDRLTMGKESDEKPGFIHNQSSQESERSVSISASDGEGGVFVPSQMMEVVDSSSQLSITSAVSAISRVGYSTADEEQEITATSSQQSTQESLGITSQEEEEVEEGKKTIVDLVDGEKKSVEVGSSCECDNDDGKTEIDGKATPRSGDIMEVDHAESGVGGGVGNNRDGEDNDESDRRRASLLKQSSEGFTPRMMVSSQSSVEDVIEKMDDDDISADNGGEKENKDVEKGDESGEHRSEVFDDKNVVRKLERTVDVDVGVNEKKCSVVEISEESSKKKDIDDDSENVKDSPGFEKSFSSTEIQKQVLLAGKEKEENNGEGRQVMEIENVEKWEKEDQEKPPVVVTDVSVSGKQVKESTVNKEKCEVKEEEEKKEGNKKEEEKNGEICRSGEKDDEGINSKKEKEEGDKKDDEKFSKKADTEMESDKEIKKNVDDADDDVIFVDSPSPTQQNIPSDGTSHLKQESGKPDISKPKDDNSNKDKVKNPQEVMMMVDVDEDDVVIPPDVLMVKAELIQNCVRGIEMTAGRFSCHYKSVYRLAHFYFHSKEHKNVELARDLLLGRSDWQERQGMPSAGLFYERKGNNFFQGLWKIPIEEIDRSGSFASHVYRSVQLLLNVLASLEDLELLNHIRNQMKRTPDAGKKYLRDWDRHQLVDEAFQRMLDVLQRRMNGTQAAGWSEDQREDHLAHTFCVWKWGKGCAQMQRATTLLHQAFRIYMKGRTDVNRLTQEQAIRYCQEKLSKATIQPSPSMTPSQTGSPVVRPSNQTNTKRSSTPVTSSAALGLEADKRTDLNATASIPKDGSSISPNKSHTVRTDQPKSSDYTPKSLVNTSHQSQKVISPCSSSSSKSLNSLATTMSSPMKTSTEVLKPNQQGPSNEVSKSDKNQFEKGRERISSTTKEIEKPIRGTETTTVTLSLTDQDVGTSIKPKGSPKSSWENAFANYVQKCSGEELVSSGSSKSNRDVDKFETESQAQHKEERDRQSSSKGESSDWGNVFSEFVHSRIEAAVSKVAEKKSWESAFSQVVSKQGVDSSGEDRKKRKLDDERKDRSGEGGGIVADKKVEMKKDGVSEEDDDDVIVISDAE